MRSLQLKNKISDTSLFAELVKHRHKHESEIKSLENLLEKKSDAKITETITIPDSNDQVDGKIEKKQDITVPVAMDIDDIPIPSDTKIEENVVKLNEIALPNNIPPMPPEKPNNLPPVPPSTTVSTSVVKNNVLETVNDAAAKVAAEKNKQKNITKLPMPPGINQTDLEAIESPPSRSPTPPPPVKAKTPPRKGIMNLPMPPGKFLKIFINF